MELDPLEGTLSEELADLAQELKSSTDVDAVSVHIFRVAAQINENLRLQIGSYETLHRAFLRKISDEN